MGPLLKDMKYYLMADEANVVVQAGTHVGGYGGGAYTVKNQLKENAIPYSFDLGDAKSEARYP